MPLRREGPVGPANIEPLTPEQDRQVDEWTGKINAALRALFCNPEQDVVEIGLGGVLPEPVCRELALAYLAAGWDGAHFEVRDEPGGEQHYFVIRRERKDGRASAPAKRPFVEPSVTERPGQADGGGGLRLPIDVRVEVFIDEHAAEQIVVRAMKKAKREGEL